MDRIKWRSNFVPGHRGQRGQKSESVSDFRDFDLGVVASVVILYAMGKH